MNEWNAKKKKILVNDTSGQKRSKTWDYFYRPIERSDIQRVLWHNVIVHILLHRLLEAELSLGHKGAKSLAESEEKRTTKQKKRALLRRGITSSQIRSVVVTYSAEISQLLLKP